MADTAGTAGTASLPTDSPVTSDDIAAFANAEEASSPSTPTDAVTPAPAIEGSESAGTSVPEETAGPLPFARHKTILEHTRREVRAAAEREWRQKYGWAEKYQPEQVEQSSRLYQWLNTNPRQFMSWLRSQVGDDAPVGSATRAPDGPPDPDLRAEDGTPVYSAPQMQKLLEWQKGQFQQLVEPLQRQQKANEERERLTTVAREAKSQASTLYQQAKASWPAFVDLQPQIMQAMKADPALSFQDAYIRVFAAEGTPKLREQLLAEYSGTLARKLDASTAPPGRPSATPKKASDLSTDELVRQEWAAMTRQR